MLFAKSELFTMSYSQEQKTLECQKDLSYFFSEMETVTELINKSPDTATWPHAQS